MRRALITASASILAAEMAADENVVVQVDDGEKGASVAKSSGREVRHLDIAEPADVYDVDASLSRKGRRAFAKGSKPRKLFRI